jgi:hypothetical protein
MGKCLKSFIYIKINDLKNNSKVKWVLFGIKILTFLQFTRYIVAGRQAGEREIMSDNER